MPPGRAPSAQQALISAEKRVRALEMKIAGKTHSQIAEALGVTRGTVSNILTQAHKVWQEEHKQLVDQHQRLTFNRLERLLGAHWEQAIKGNPQSTQTVLSVIDRQMRLLGIDKSPTLQVNQTNLIGVAPEELVRRARMVGIDFSDLRMEAPQLAHDPDVIDVEVIENGEGGVQQTGTNPEG